MQCFANTRIEEGVFIQHILKMALLFFLALIFLANTRIEDVVFIQHFLKMALLIFLALIFFANTRIEEGCFFLKMALLIFLLLTTIGEIFLLGARLRTCCLAFIQHFLKMDLLIFLAS